jgi:cyclopropane-fatty-acyl-phospholipid synthase
MCGADPTTTNHESGTGRGGIWAALARSIVRRALRLLRHGRIELHDAGGVSVHGDPDSDLRACVRVRHPGFHRAVAFEGNIGAAESYMRGEWEVDDLTALCRIVVRNRDAFNALDGVWSTLAKPLRQITHFLSRNTTRGSRRNIAAHYDLSNEFFGLWLDESMLYSSGLYRGETGTIPTVDLARAQHEKMARVVRMLRLSPTDHLGEIGTGWGGMALHAARTSGCCVTTTTISAEQAKLARRRVEASGMSSRVTVVEQDYRRFTPPNAAGFDALVSIEMVEAVGAAFLPGYFDACARLIKPDGRFLMQAIVIVDEHYDQALGHVDFIKKYIFPGSFMPCRGILRREAARAGFEVEDTFEMGNDYAETLAEWRRRFRDRIGEVRALGFGEEFVRMWEWYLCYCEAGFREGHLGVVQMTMRKKHAPQSTEGAERREMK